MAAAGSAPEVTRAAPRRHQMGSVPCEQQQACGGGGLQGAPRRRSIDTPETLCAGIWALGDLTSLDEANGASTVVMKRRAERGVRLGNGRAGRGGSRHQYVKLTSKRKPVVSV